MTLTPVTSSNIAALGYDSATRQLHIQFRGSGGLYRYDDVPPQDAHALMHADSIGKHFALNVRRKFSGVRV